MKIVEIHPTVFLRKQNGSLEQLCRVTVEHDGPPGAWTVVARAEGTCVETFLGHVPRGNSTYDVFVREIKNPGPVEFELKADRSDVATVNQVVEWRQPKHWRVHVIQLSHHDVGYTDLPSRVLTEHARFLDAAIDMAASTQDFPEEARFRIVVECMWSLLHFLRTAPEERGARMIQLLASGDVEAAALFGNVTTELCGHETLVRMLYPAFRLKRCYGIPIISAEHNDIPGFSWGLCRILADAGIKFFSPGLPLYYGWVKEDLPSFWDEKAVFGRKGPGAFWWESPTGKRVLFWCNNSGCGGDCRPDMPGLADRLQALSDDGYPYDLLRWPVQGAARDNSPYIDGYARTIRAWNEQWAYPQLVSSTNARFFGEFVEVVPPDLPVHRGELPGQDYPVGATSTALETAVNRSSHFRMPAAETFASLAAHTTDLGYPEKMIDSAYEEMLWHDEHTWGFHRPAHGPAVETSQAEKAVHAHRGAALCDDVAWKAIARIADHIRREEPGLHLVVFNATSSPYTGPVTVPLQEWSNCGGEIISVGGDKDKRGSSHLAWASLTDRGHVAPGIEIVKGAFDLMDVTTGEVLPFEIREIESPLDTVPYAGDRLGVSHLGRRDRPFSAEDAARRDFLFVARDIPPTGYRTYRLVPRKEPNKKAFPKNKRETTLENEFYVVQTERRSGQIRSIYDKELGIELVDARAPHPFGAIIVREPLTEKEHVLSGFSYSSMREGPLAMTLAWEGEALGHPRVRRTLTLHRGMKRVDLAVRILKDPTPLLEVHLAFPFDVSAPRFRYEGVLSVMSPIVDYLPGAQSDRIAVQNWVAVKGDEQTVLWSSLDAPVVSLGRLWQGYVSPAHRCVRGDDRQHYPLKPEDLDRGWVYSNLYNNNFQTNFAISQTSCDLFRFSFTTRGCDVSDADAAVFGSQCVTPIETVFTDQVRSPKLSASHSFIHIDPPEVSLLAFKRAGDGRGLILRLWNRTDRPVTVRAKMPGLVISRIWRASITEEDEGQILPPSGNEIAAPLDPREVATLRIELA